MKYVNVKSLSMSRTLLFSITFFTTTILVFNQCSESTSSDSVKPLASQVKVGQVLKTKYFDVTVNKTQVSKNVETGNEFSDVKASPGMKFLIMNVTFKNTNNESRTLFDGGPLFITYNGKKFQFDNPETIMLEGYGVILEQVNPLSSVTTNLVYKIAEEVHGPTYWNPSRADEDELIYIGEI